MHRTRLCGRPLGVRLKTGYLAVKRADAVPSCQTAVPNRDVLLGVALSGGGSRAALFGAAGLEALARI